LRTLAKLAIALLAVYLAFLASVYVMMRQPPERFAAAIGRMPGPFFLVFPFETLWTHARAGKVAVGEQAPDFRLRTLDGKAQVSLASFRSQKPVVLIFGSYT